MRKDGETTTDSRENTSGAWRPGRDEGPLPRIAAAAIDRSIGLTQTLVNPVVGDYACTSMNRRGFLFRRLSIKLLPAVMMAIACLAPRADAQGDADTVETLISVPAQAQPIMPVADVRVGMKGYGLTVFHGTKIEPFPVEVLSVVSDEGPDRAVIWVRCDDPRLVESGPVQGMSGSPIYLWDEGVKGEIGEGGRLIGAFAFGYSWATNCIAGVQPIELMRDVGTRTDQGEPANAANPNGARQTLRTLRQTASDRGIPGYARFQLDAISRLLGDDDQDADAGSDPSPMTGPMGHASVERMLVPMSVGHASTADLLAPLLRPMGLAPMANGMNTIAGTPPTGTDPNTQIQPGSVLSIPLAYGDMDLSGAGTATDVLPDGTVLAFGHAMFGQGASAVPMSTGYVHFVSSRENMSFKVSGSMKIAGTISRDENSAVAGNDAMTFKVAPLDVSVAIAGQAPRDYQYNVVDHPLLTPVAATICTIQSVTAVQALPMRNTMRLDAEMTFTGGRKLNITSMAPMAAGDEVAMAILPPIATAMQNPFESLKLESMSARVTVEPTVRMASLQNVRIDKPVVEPGGKIKLAIDIQPFNEPVRTVRAELVVPADTPEGDYPLVIADAQNHLGQLFMTRSHLFQATDIDQLFDALQRINEVENNVLYLSLILTEKGIAIGREELPQLPSSRRAMILTPTSTAAIPYLESVEQTVPLDLVVQGRQDFFIQVRKPHSEMPIQ